ncbi:hypothetical protein [Nioella aestuarii]|uniref:hypothetical protein n=1 Tax=Nioella aestuarii TaxID=1662864 RepID=UPI003D7FF8DB
MSFVVPILFLPAFVLFAVAVINLLRAMFHVRHDQRWETRLNIVIWLSEYRTKTTFDETGQVLIRRARKYRSWFLKYCLFLLLVLLAVAIFGPGGTV